jgi:hypothetical protein
MGECVWRFLWHKHHQQERDTHKAKQGIMMKSLFYSAIGFVGISAQTELLVKTTAGLGKSLIFILTTVFNSSLVQGHYNEANVKEWNGIPYATPPVGDLRWEQSIPPTPWGDDVYTGWFLILS